MGYLLPITHFQYMQYNNRVVSYNTAKQDHQPVSALTSVFPTILHAKSQELPFPMNQQTISLTKQSYRKGIEIEERAFKNTSPFTGKGALFDEYV